MKYEDYPIVNCRVCGCSQVAYYVEEMMNSMVEKKLCFDCLFWEDHKKDDLGDDKDRFVIVDGSHYLLGVEDANPRHGCGRGYGGSTFLIDFFDGRKIKSTNVWC